MVQNDTAFSLILLTCLGLRDIFLKLIHLKFPSHSYSKAKQRYLRSRKELSPGLHLASAAEAGALVSSQISDALMNV